MKHFFRPNALTTREEDLLITAGWVLVGLLVWSFFHPPLIPSPLEILRAIGKLWSDGVLTTELMASFVTNVQALVYSTVLSLGLAYATVLPIIRSPVATVSKMRFLGLTGLTLPFTLFFPGSLKVAILTFGMTTWFVTNMADVVAAIPREKFDHARTLRYPEWRVVWEVIILGYAAEAFEVLRANQAVGWLMLGSVEVISQAGGGIGLVLYKANRQYERMPEVFAIMFMFMLVGLVNDRAITWLRTQLCPWANLRRERS